jgi:hypothetical protein
LVEEREEGVEGGREGRREEGDGGSGLEIEFP